MDPRTAGPLRLCQGGEIRERPRRTKAKGKKCEKTSHRLPLVHAARERETSKALPKSTSKNGCRTHQNITQITLLFASLVQKNIQPSTAGPAWPRARAGPPRPIPAPDRCVDHRSCRPWLGGHRSLTSSSVGLVVREKPLRTG